MKNHPFLLVLISLIHSICFAQNKIKVEDYKSDIEYLKETLPLKHPNLFFHQSEKTFNTKLDSIASNENLSKQSKLKIHMQLREVIAELGDPHTNFGFYETLDEERYFPLEMYWFNDGIWIMGADSKYHEALGKELIAINTIPIKQVIEEVSKVVPKNEPYFAKKRIAYFLFSNGILKAYNISTGNSALFTFRGSNGESMDIEVSAEGQKYVVDDFEPMQDLPEFWQRPHSDLVPLFQQKYIEQDSILVIQYNSCWGRELEERFGDKIEAEKLPYFGSFASEVFEILDKKPVAKLLFDMRFNGGGSSPQGTRLIEKLSLNKEINRQGRLFVATSEHTFSSAVINTMNFRQLTEALIIGTPSGGTPNHYGEVRTLVLPKTGLEVYHSTNYFKYIDGDAKAVYPDIEVETNYSDIFNGKDPIYEFVKNYKN